MTGALIWKEWRQQRSLVLAALAAALVLPLFTFFGSFGRFRFDSLTQVLPALQMIVLLPVFAAATGALCFAGPGFLLVLFGSSVFWSTRSARPLHAMLAGILTTMVLVAGQTAMALLALQTNVRPPLYTQWPLMVCAALLVASFLSFRASDPATT